MWTSLYAKCVVKYFELIDKFLLRIVVGVILISQAKWFELITLLVDGKLLEYQIDVGGRELHPHPSKTR